MVTNTVTQVVEVPSEFRIQVRKRECVDEHFESVLPGLRIRTGYVVVNTVLAARPLT
jgi:hypothetical protein